MLSLVSRGLLEPTPAGPQPFTVCTQLYAIDFQYEFQMGYKIVRFVPQTYLINDIRDFLMYCQLICDRVYCLALFCDPVSLGNVK